MNEGIMKNKQPEIADEKSQCGDAAETVTPDKGKAVKLLAQTMGLAAAIGGPYMMQDMEGFSGGKPRRVVSVLRCHVCGATKVTLYEDGENRICRKCKNKKEE